MSSPSQIEAQALAGADEAGEFCIRVLNDPKEAIKDATGLSLPDGIIIHALDDGATDYHLVLPPVGCNLPAGEISAIAGGIGVDDVRNSTNTQTW